MLLMHTAEVCTIIRNSDEFRKGFKLVKVSTWLHSSVPLNMKRLHWEAS
jgi:hypothetical protein